MLKKASMLSAAVLLLALAVGVNGQATKASKPEDPVAAKLKALNVEFSKAQSEYYAPYQKAKTEEEAAKIKLDPAKNPAKAFVPRFKAIAHEAGKTSTALQAWMAVYNLAQESNDASAANEALDRLVADHANAPEISRFLGQVSYAYPSLAGEERRDKILAIIDRVSAATTLPDVKAAALYYRAKTIESTKGSPSDVSQTYDKLIALYPDTQYGKLAKGDKFEAENLVPGKPALDFEAEDQDGVKFKLSDYRGKVVVLDFWGWW